ncbi:MAG: protein-L-isoaspartate(D-aspartate) O-methyltransferase [Bacteroidia bacterium]|jgi:protein-L-isoaspartate(D-aspartate) O-methyltransferase
MEVIKEKGVKDTAVLNAMMQVPRHLFINSVFERQAYEDKAFRIGAGQTISQPYTVGFQSQLLKLTKGMKVLEIGTGSGYQAAVLHAMGAKVFSVERQKELFDSTKGLLLKLGFRVKCFYGDGYAGLPSFAPFDRIIITAGAPSIPAALVDQLKPGGIMVIPITKGEEEIMTTLDKAEDGTTTIKEHGVFRFVPMLGNKAGQSS